MTMSRFFTVTPWSRYLRRNAGSATNNADRQLQHRFTGMPYISRKLFLLLVQLFSVKL